MLTGTQRTSESLRGSWQVFTRPVAPGMHMSGFWNACQSRRGELSGASWGVGRLLGRLLEASAGLFWPFRGSWVPLRASWGVSWGPLGATLGLAKALRGASWTGKLCFQVFVSLFDRSAGLSSELLLPFWAILGPSWGLLGPFRDRLGGLLGRFGAVLGASWAVLERRKAEKARRQKTSKKQMKINDFGFRGPSWRCTWSALGASWRPLGPS